MLKAVPVMVIDPHNAWGQPIKPFYSREEMLAGITMQVSCHGCGYTREISFRLDPASMPTMKELAPRATNATGFKCGGCGKRSFVTISPVPDIGIGHVR